MLAGILDNAVPNGNIGIELNAFLYEKIYFVLFLLVLLKISENVFHVSRFRGTFAMLQILFPATIHIRSIRELQRWN